MDNDSTELHAIVKGRVQGVCFRATVSDLAHELDLTGTVQNLSDGTVEVYAQGAKADLDQLLKQLKESPGQSRVDGIDATYNKPLREFASFDIVH